MDYRKITTHQLKKAMAGTIAGHEAGDNRRKLIAACVVAGHTPDTILREYPTTYKIEGGGQRVRQCVQYDKAVEVVTVAGSDWVEKAHADGVNSFTGVMWACDLDTLQRWANEWAGKSVNLKLV